ncbi:hypothetical protein [Photobacterium sp. 1_MG-2023]|uniref:hypothetical protein n=1 Tax=Photobacterium sp. 1_MG-2023 TaxID=3062646 RepID=UPI0026E40D4D|nr:hypothetical protein [Photobacterium sp. 1_MG-2023]MDO6708125.1 hypothetical protein [Photobacterium sp. 1_MG-2023]
MKVKKPLICPEELHDITLKLEHNEMRDKPEDMLMSLYCYTKGYRRFVELIGEQVEPEYLSVFKLDHVERGSVKLKNKVGYRPGLINFIAIQLAKLMIDDTTDDNLEEKAIELEQNTSDFIDENSVSGNSLVNDKKEPYIDRITLAEIMADFSKGGELLLRKEYFEVSDNSVKENSNVFRFDKAFRSHVSINELKKAKHEPYNGDDTVIALRPCNVGDASWYVESIKTKRKYFVRIGDKEWLSKYQTGRMEVVRANDLIHVNLKCDVVEAKKGSSRNVNAVITKVHGVEEGKHLSPNQQANLFE